MTLLPFQSTLDRDSSSLLTSILQGKHLSAEVRFFQPNLGEKEPTEMILVALPHMSFRSARSLLEKKLNRDMWMESAEKKNIVSWHRGWGDDIVLTTVDRNNTLGAIQYRVMSKEDVGEFDKRHPNVNLMQRSFAEHVDLSKVPDCGLEPSCP